MYVRVFATPSRCTCPRCFYTRFVQDDSGKIELKRLTVIFDDNVLVRTEGDYEPGKGVRIKAAEDDAEGDSGTVDS